MSRSNSIRLSVCYPILVAVMASGAVPAPSLAQSDESNQVAESDASKTVVSDKADQDPNEQDAATAKKSTKKKSAAVVRLVLKGSMTEAVEPPGLFAELQHNLRQTIDRMDKAATDEKVDAVVLRIRGLQIGRGKLSELRQAIGRMRHQGKTVFADLHFAAPADYLVASACDQVVMPESGSLMLPGVRAEVTFFKDLFDKLGLRADILQVGDFKGAAEPYTRSKMSDAFRGQYELVVDGLYDQMVDMIADDRQLSRKDVEHQIDQGLFMAHDAKQVGLIDLVAYEDGYEQRLKQTLEVEELKYLKGYAKSKVDTDFSGMAGMFKFFEMMTGNGGKSRKSRKQKIAIVYAVGAITSGKSTADILGNSTLGSDSLVAALRKAEKDETVAGIVLRIDSPGGSALASDLIWRQVIRCEKPIVASMGDTAASGGYYIAMGCDKILAEPGTITGSIGVVGGKIVTGGLMDKVGVTTDVISRGRNVGIFSSTTAFTATERQAFKRSMLQTYEQFTAKAAEGRGMDLERLKSLAGGRIWTGRQAQQKGLVDDVGTLHDAVRLSRRLAGVSEDDETDILVLPKPRSFFEQLLESDEDEVRSIPLADRLGAAVAPDVWQAYQLFREPFLMWLPYRITIR